jgi:hypothetical protein
MQPSHPIKHTKSSLTEEMRMMNHRFPQRRPQPNSNFRKNNNGRPVGFPMHNTFTNQGMIPSNGGRGTHSITNPLQRSTNYRSFQNRNNPNMNPINRNNPRSMATFKSNNQLGASRSFAPGLPSSSIHHSNVISVREVNPRTRSVKDPKFLENLEDL